MTILVCKQSTIDDRMTLYQRRLEASFKLAIAALHALRCCAVHARYLLQDSRGVWEHGARFGAHCSRIVRCGHTTSATTRLAARPAVPIPAARVYRCTLHDAPPLLREAGMGRCHVMVCPDAA